MPIMPAMSHTLNFLWLDKCSVLPALNSKKLSQLLLPTHFCPFVNVTEYLLLMFPFQFYVFVVLFIKTFFATKAL